MARSARHPHGAPSPEWAALLAGARVQLTAADQSRLLDALNAQVDWNGLRDLAFRHDVAPLFLRALQSIRIPPGVPAALLAALQRARAANALRNALLFDDLARVLVCARDQQLPVIVLKGAALAEPVYGDRALRAMRDVDLLIHAEHLAGFEALSASRGYHLEGEWARARAWHRQHDYHLAYYKRVDGLPTTSIELHWQLDRPSRPFQFDLEGMWGRAVPATVAGVPAKTLAPEDTLLHLCLHICKHKLTAGLRSYCDIAEVVRCHSDDIDWTAVTQRASEWGVSAFVHVPLALTRDLLDAPVPDAVLERLMSASFDRRVVSMAKQAVMEDPLAAQLFPDFFTLTRGASVAVRTQVLAKLLSPAVVASRYRVRRGSLQMWWRYPQRLAQLCRSYGPLFWQFLRRGPESIAHAHQRSQLLRFLQIFDPVRRQDDAEGRCRQALPADDTHGAAPTPSQ